MYDLKIAIPSVGSLPPCVASLERLVLGQDLVNMSSLPSTSFLFPRSYNYQPATLIHS